MAKVLLVEDDESVRGGLAILLSADGHEIVGEAGNGQEALHLLANGCNPDVILLDLHMPIMNGWQFLARLREGTDHPVPPVIVVSALRVGNVLPPVVAEIDKHSLEGRLSSAIGMAIAARAERPRRRA